MFCPYNTREYKKPQRAVSSFSPSAMHPLMSIFMGEMLMDPYPSLRGYWQLMGSFWEGEVIFLNTVVTHKLPKHQSVGPHLCSCKQL